METQKPVPYFMTICVTVIIIFLALLTFNSYHESQSNQMTLVPIVTAKDNRIIIPEIPVKIAITAEKNQDAAAMEAIITVGETMSHQCLWTEAKIDADYYLPYAKIDTKVFKDHVTAQATVDKSVCPEKK